MSESSGKGGLIACALVFGCLGLVGAALIGVGIMFLGGDGSGGPLGPTHVEGGSGSHSAHREPAPSNALELVFTYGSEKKKWIDDVTKTFNAAKHKAGNGKPIFVTAIPMGSGESMKEILDGHRQTHLASPASMAFITLYNAESEKQTGKPLIEDTDKLVISPVVIAMWEPMATALGWPEKQIGWSDVIEMAKDPKGWASKGHPEWGRFKFGHTHPEFSNSGLISLLAESYAAAGKTRDLTLADIQKPETAKYLRAIELAVVHYGDSTGFFGRKMFKNGPQYLSAAVLYESMVIESRTRTPPTEAPVVAIYPKEGTFYSDHPVGIVNRPWVTDDHREAAERYIEYLLDEPQQRKALTYGFRPGNFDVPKGPPVDQAHGVDPDQPKTVLEPPSAEVMSAIIDLWKDNKKHANVVLVLDTSGSMKGEALRGAKQGARALIDMLGDKDRITLVSFSSRVHTLESEVMVGEGRGRVLGRVNGLQASGGTALYDATKQAFDLIQNDPPKDMINAVVVLTDGADRNSNINLGRLIQHVKGDNETKTTRVFTIGYGDGAQKDELEAISNATEAEFHTGDPRSIREVFKDIATFF